MLARIIHVERERDELRAQADGLYDEVIRLRAENDAWQDAMLDLTERFDQAQPEIERLRAALEKIAGLAHRPDFHVGGVQSLIWNEATLALGRSNE